MDDDRKILLTDALPEPEVAEEPATPLLPPNVRSMSVTDLILMCNDAASKMSERSDHRLLVMNCAFALRQLVDRLAMHEGTIQ